MDTCAVGYFRTMGNPKSDWRYETQPDKGIAGDLYPGQEAGSWVVRVQLMAFFMSVDNLRILILGLNLVVPVGLGMMFCLISSAQKNGMALMKWAQGKRWSSFCTIFPPKSRYCGPLGRCCRGSRLSA